MRCASLHRRLTRLHAAATHSNVNLNHGPHRTFRRQSRGKSIDVIGVVDDYDGVGDLPQRREPAQLENANERIRDQQIVHPGCRHDLGLAELRAGQADRAGGHHLARDVGALVALGVRTPGEALLGAVGAHLSHIALEYIEVKQQAGGVDLVASRSGRGLVKVCHAVDRPGACPAFL